MLVPTGDIQLASSQQWVAQGGLLQLQHRMLTFDQEIAELLPVSLLMQLFDVVELHGGSVPRSVGPVLPKDLATASATRIPSTPADRMPPA